MEIDWESLSQQDLVKLITEAKTEAERRMAEFRAAWTLDTPAPKGPGRPRSNGVTAQD
jgi:hypothetical protein